MNKHNKIFLAKQKFFNKYINNSIFLLHKNIQLDLCLFDLKSIKWI